MIIKNLRLKLYLKKNIKKGLTIGKDCYIRSRVNFGSEPYLIRIGNHVRITEGVRFVTHDGGVWVFRNEKEFENIDKFGPIVVGDNVHIGVNSIILPNVHIGNNVIIGAGSVVTKDIPSNSIVAGVPARIIESLEEYKGKALRNGVNTHSLSNKDKKKILLDNLHNK